MLVEGDGRDVSGDAVGKKETELKWTGHCLVQQCPNKSSKPSSEPRSRSLGDGIGRSIPNSGMFRHIFPPDKAQGGLIGT